MQESPTSILFSLFVFFIFCHSLDLLYFLSLSLPHNASLPISLCLSLSPTLTLPHSLSPSLSLSLSIYLSLPHSLSPSLSVSFSLPLSSVSLSQELLRHFLPRLKSSQEQNQPLHQVRTIHSTSFPLFPPLILPLIPSISTSYPLYFYLFFPLFPSNSTPYPLYFYPLSPLFLPLFPSISTSFPFYFWLSLYSFFLHLILFFFSPLPFVSFFYCITLNLFFLLLSLFGYVFNSPSLSVYF